MANVFYDSSSFPDGGGNTFDLLKYMNDDSLIATLGIEATLVSDDCNTKLLDPDANNYADLLPSTPPQPGNLNYVSGNETTYYTIDTEPPGINNLGTEVKSPPAQLNTASPGYQTNFIATNSVFPPVNIGNASQILRDTSVIIVSSAESETDPPLSIALTEPFSEPVNSTEPETPIATEPELKACDKSPRKSRRRRPRKEKVYEIDTPLPDPILEKKRQNAINAKKNRDRKKDQLRELDRKVSEVTKERDRLHAEVKKLREREQELRQQLLIKYNYSVTDF